MAEQEIYTERERIELEHEKLRMEMEKVGSFANEQEIIRRNIEVLLKIDVKKLGLEEDMEEELGWIEDRLFKHVKELRPYKETPEVTEVKDK